MADVVARGEVEITTDASKVQSGLKTAGSKAGAGFKSGFGSALKGLAAAAGITAIGAVVTKTLRDSIGEAREAQKVGAATEQQIKSTGGVAGVTAKEISNLANALSMKAGVDDEEIQAGQNMLLMFTNIRNEAGKGNDIFSQASRTMVDLAAKTGSETGAAKMLGKALNDPTRGLAGLTRAGVQFTATETERIKKMAESGNLMGAQKVILKALQDRVGGLAASQATAGEKMSVAWKNVEETIGMALLPVLDQVETALATQILPAVQGFIAGMQSGTGAGGQFAAVLSNIWSVATGIAGVLFPIIATLFQFGAALLSNKAVVIAIVAVLGIWAASVTAIAVVHGVLMAIQLAQTAATIAQQAAIVIVTIAQYAWAAASYAAGAAMAFLTGPIGLVVLAIMAIIAAIVLVVKYHDQIGRALKAAWDAIVNAVKAAVSAILNFIKSNWKTILVILTGPLGLAVALVARYWDQIKKAISTALNAIWSLIKSVWTAITNGIRSYIEAERAVVVAGFNAVKAAVTAAMNAVESVVKAVWTAIVGAFRGGVAGAVGVVSGLMGALRGFIGTAAGIGRSIGSGFINALKAALHFAGGIIGAVKSAVNNALGLPIHIPGPGPLPDINIPAFARGLVATTPTLGWIGESGPEVVVPLRSGAALAPGVADAIDLFTRRRGISRDGATINVMLPTGDPEAAAMAVLNRLATAGV